MLQKACLIIIDGWGISKGNNPVGDSILNANTPVMTTLAKDYPNIDLAAHGVNVGLPEGLMGNSEVGHLNIGAGRVVYQDIVRIDLAVKKHTLCKQPTFEDAFKRAKASGKIHLCGLISDGGVHSHILHLFEILAEAKAYGIKECFIHFFADGRDTSPRSAVAYLKQLNDKISSLDYGSIASICGRYYAMDRDKRWERIKLAYDAMVSGMGEESDDLIATIEARYQKDETDEFLKPIIGNKNGMLNDGDTLVCFNYRSDRMREIAQSLGSNADLPFETNKTVQNLDIITMTRYKSEFPYPLVFPPQSMDNVLAEWLSKKPNIKQVHIAETEKIAHVTFFFNGGQEAHFPNEERDLIDSPKVATYDLKPEMSAIAVAEKVAQRICNQEHSFVMCNFAPPDMVGHTGIYEAAVKAIEATDQAIGIIYEACKKNDYILFVTADHGNAEKMLADDGITPHTAHTCSKVPFIMTCKEQAFDFGGDEEPGLCDVAPTLLEVMGIDKPDEMTGRSLLLKR